MSLGARATKGGAKGKDGKQQDKGKLTDKQQPKEKAKPQATTEQLRMANIVDRKGEDADVRRMVTQLMETTCRSEEEVCSALHDTDNDMDAACNLLLEESARIQSEWQTNEKKKKKPPAPSSNGEVEAVKEGREPREARDPRGRSGPRPRRGEGEGARGRGSGRGRGGTRGGRGGRGGRRGMGGRGGRDRGENTWNNADNGGNMGDSFPTTEDWDNEEWSGSLSDTKVFTPSSLAQNAADGDAAPAQITPSEDWEVPESNGPTEGHIPTYTYHNTQQHHSNIIEQQMVSVPSGIPASGGPVANVQQAPPVVAETVDTYHHQPMGMSGSLSAAQSQYLSQLTHQAQRHDNSVYASNYGVYGSSDMSSQRKPQRARVPPPSKIPSSAVEMPGGGESGGGIFLDVQFGALEPETIDTPQHTPQVQVGQQVPTALTPPQPTQPTAQPMQNAQPTQQPHTPVQQRPKQVTPQGEQPVAPSHGTVSEATTTTYPNPNAMLSESMNAVESTATSQPPPSEPAVSNATSIEKLTASLAAAVVADTSTSSVAQSMHHHHQHYAPHSHRTKQPATGAGAVLYPSGGVSHHPPLYGSTLYAPQVNSNAGSLAGAVAGAGVAGVAAGVGATHAAPINPASYPSSVTLTTYQPIMNSYQQTSSSAGVYSGNALYTAAPYTPYQPTQMPAKHKEQTQYDNSVASSNSLTNASTTQQTSTAKVAATTASAAVNSGVSSTSGSSAAAAGAGYAAGALYGGTYYDEQLCRGSLPHHMGGYYEVGYGGRDGGTFGLGAAERFPRTDAASPQQVPAALPPGYAYFYQPPPTTYQYGVYPTYGGGSNVGGVGGVGGVGVSTGGKVSAYSQQQQPPYDAQDTYKPGGPYTGNANKTAAAASADLTNAMYGKPHVALNKVNTYEKAGFHSGTPPPFGAASHLYIAPPHHHPHHHPQHQMDVRVNSSHTRRESGAGGRAAGGKAAGSKPTYSQSYWAPN